MAGLESMPEEAPAGDSQANGFIERGVQSFEMQLRTLKSSTEARLQTKIPVNHPMCSYMALHAADLLNKYEVSKDGRTAW